MSIAKSRLEFVVTDTQVDGGRLMAKQAVMAFSGGMDSTGLLMHLIANDYTVHTLSYDYGQKHKIELDRAKANIQYLKNHNIPVSHKIVDLQSAMSVFHSALTTEDYEIPEGHYEEEQMKQTVVPNRNAIFASILYVYALSIALKEDQEITVFYDGKCPLCRREIDFYKLKDKRAVIAWFDISLLGPGDVLPG